MNRFEQEFKDDPLIFLHYTSGVPWFRHSKVHKFFFLFMAISLELLMMYAVLDYRFEKPEIELWKYASFFFMTQGFVCIFVAQILVYDRLADFSALLQGNAWSLKSAGEKMFLQISTGCKRTIALCNFGSFMMIFTAVIFFPFLGNENEWQYPTYIFQKHPSYFVQNYPLLVKVIFNICFGFSLVVCGISFAPLMNLTIYILFHLKVQYLLLNASIIRFGCRGVYHINDIRYQERIARQLKLCIKRQLQLDRILADGEDFIYRIVILLCIFGLINFVASSFFISSGVSPSSNFRMYICLGVWFVELFIYCSFSQQVTEETEKVFWNLCKCHWEDWNNQNRRTLLMMLVKASNPTTIRGFVDVNYTLIRKMYRVGNLLVWIFAYNLE